MNGRTQNWHIEVSKKFRNSMRAKSCKLYVWIDGEMDTGYVVQGLDKQDCFEEFLMIEEFNIDYYKTRQDELENDLSKYTEWNWMFGDNVSSVKLRVDGLITIIKQNNNNQLL